MVGATCQWLYDTLHLQLEEQGGELSDGDVCLYGELVELEIAAFIKDSGDSLFVITEVGEDGSLYAFSLCLLTLCICLPTHSIYKILGTSDERGPVVANQLVAAFAIGSTHGTREGENTPVIVHSDA